MGIDIGPDLKLKTVTLGSLDGKLDTLDLRYKRSEESTHDEITETNSTYGALEERAGEGAPREFWTTNILFLYVLDMWSSAYPKGNQGDDLLALNSDTHRYVVQSTGCGPQDCTLNINAGFGASVMWVCK